ncbi:MAG: hypothetical protein WCS94_20760 [Verrucomicrobiota bacterium]
MRTPYKTIIILLLLTAVLASATEKMPWRVLALGAERYFISEEFPKVRLAIALEGGEPKPLSWEIAKENPKLGLLRYHAGSAGTSQIYSTIRVALVRLSDGKLLGCPALKYVAEGNSPKLQQPVWSWSGGVLTVKDVEYAETNTYGP